ncbi:hypothetical protein SAMN05660860_03266 [Geoalkalibacter ferrihydriticus]|uniref:DUF3179 domain-containing protein n=2 Tax=Geoalkalibacter ferrihydriticus TaxID=392333 RepID=A0A0C2HKC3_9BACT|nr:hypothetical protein [Geoalkalibacter ferrihydriticus]KIH75470.1 hypothetical protein GFER_16040 [Geoalkalibacter ferrihydriticus DSM 17813]SDM84785.1 hypothetical protein SAMN05660860_03266 [Geoalkalibacter ferrihydriticus]
MKKIFLLLCILLLVAQLASAQMVSAPPDYRSWPSHPRVPTMTPDQIQELMLKGEKLVLIYAGFQTDRVICGSIHIPYQLTPPFGDGTKVQPVFPKDAWLVAYCP